jgi:hypothetical protein
VATGKTAHLDITIPGKELRFWDTVKKDYVIEAGDYELLIGAASDDIRSKLPLKITGK